MTTLQVAGFILLWIVIAVEGVLLLLLYRHVGLMYGHKESGLAVDLPAPPLLAQAAQGQRVTLPELLKADYNLLVFGSPGCSGCRALLQDHGVSPFLTARGMAGYFLTDHSEMSTDDVSLEMLGVDKKAFQNYAINETPFAYIVARGGTIIARGDVGGGLQDLARLCEQAHRHDHSSAQAPIHVSPAHRASQ
jgi:cytochrome oxidase Cu insertion factor (SCO1/SenC/PrrC family)